MDRSATYNVTFDNDGESITATGQQLKETGLTVHLKRVHSSELILYERTQDQDERT